MYKSNRSYGFLMVVLMVSITIGTISAAKTAPSSLSSTVTAKNINTLKTSIESHRPSNGGLYDNDLKETFYAVGALTRLGQSIEKDGELCKQVSKVIAERSNDIESVFYGVSILSELKCLTSNPVKLATIETTLQKSLEQGNIVELTSAINTVFLLLDAKSISYDLANLESAASRLVSLMDADGEFKFESGADQASLTYNGLAYFTVARLSHRLKSSVAGVSNLVEKVVSKIPSVVSSATESSASGLFWDDLATTSSILRGLVALTSQSDKAVSVLTPLQMQRVGDYLLKYKSTTVLADSYNMVIGLKSCQKNVFGQPLSVQLTPTSFASSGASKILNVQVRDIFDGPVDATVTVSKITLATSRSNAIISNKELGKDNTLDVSELKLGSYVADIKIAPVGDNYHPFTVTRTITVSGQAAVKDFKLIVADTKEGLTNSKNIFPVETERQLSLSLPANKTARIFFRVISGDQPFQAQQVGIRFASNVNPSVETVVQALFSVDSYSFVINSRELGKLVNYLGGAYQVQVIVGDSSIAPLTWEAGQLVLNFDQDVIPTTRYPAHQAIAHRFRVPENRPPQVVSQTFTLAVLAPLAIFLLGLPVLGANLNRFPGGMGFIYTVAFIGCMAAVGFLIITYWFSLTMVVTLQYLALLLIPTVFFGHKTLSHFAQERVSKPKTN